jgi:uncharacterized protein YndB with AHSA1/START domain
MEMVGELVVKKSIVINAPPTKVWEALTNPSYTKKYMFALDVESDWRPGSRIIWSGDAGGIRTYRKGKVLKTEPGRLLKFTDFNPSTGAEDIDENHAHRTYQLKAVGGTTVLSVTTDHLDGDEARRKDSEGFWDRVLPALKMLLESE